MIYIIDLFLIIIGFLVAVIIRYMIKYKEDLGDFIAEQDDDSEIDVLNTIAEHLEVIYVQAKIIMLDEPLPENSEVVYNRIDDLEELLNFIGKRLIDTATILRAGAGAGVSIHLLGEDFGNIIKTNSKQG